MFIASTHPEIVRRAKAVVTTAAAEVARAEKVMAGAAAKVVSGVATIVTTARNQSQYNKQ